jgi:hypothetical protein
MLPVALEEALNITDDAKLAYDFQQIFMANDSTATDQHEPIGLITAA